MKALTPKQHEFLARCIARAHAANAGGQFGTAAGWCRKALEVEPGLPEAWYNLGLALSGQGQASEGTEALLKAAAGVRDNPDAQNSIGLQLFRNGADAQAEQCLQRALELAPDFAFAHSNLGLLRNRQNRLEEARAALSKAIALQPRLAAAHANLACTLNAQRNFAAGEAACRTALQLEAGLPVAWSNLGCALFGLHRTDEAEAACRKALALEPGLAEPHTVLAGILMARGAYREALDEFAIGLGKDPFNIEALSSRLFCLNYVPGSSPSAMLAAASAFDAAASRGVTPFSSWECDPHPERKLRIGLVSGDLRRHPVGYFLEGPLRELDKAAFEIVAYSSYPKRDDQSEVLASHCAAWTDVTGTSDAELARRIHQDRIDILVDLSGHSEHNRLGVFVRKPAPVQATWLGYFATTGVRAIDWKIGDSWATPEGEEDHFSERIWRLPDSCFCAYPPRDAPGVGELPSRAAGFVTYGCFNNFFKINDRVIEVWSRILRADMSGRLFLKSSQLADGNLHPSLAARFGRHGIAPERLVLEASGSYASYLAAYGRVDIALDPFPYTGGATTAEGLWMGVPVVTLKGDRFISHQGESLLHAAGLSEWIASSEEEYVGIALAAASDRDALSSARAGLRAKVGRSPLFDAPRFARHLGSAWRGMWREWCASRGTAG
ncbi:MAG: tetratricopeptide repeat protein [Betaproteobacteria bacterium]|nr:tetratricopeptide repeat protein [Betaproteobacteria bacterium]